MPESKKPIFVNIKSDRTGHINIEWGLRVFINVEKDKKLSCYVPGYDIYFSTSDRGNVEKKCRILTTFLFDNFFIHSKKDSLKKFVLHLHKLGFRTNKNNDAFIIHQISKNKFTPVKFNSSPNIPEDFINGESLSIQNNMEVAM